MSEKALENYIITLLNQLDETYVFNNNNIPTPNFNSSRQFVGFRGNSHVPGLSDIGGVLLGFPLYLEIKTPSSIKTFMNDVKSNEVINAKKSKYKRVKRHKEQWEFLIRMELCGALTGVVWSLDSLFDLPWWTREPMSKHKNILKNHVKC